MTNLKYNHQDLELKDFFRFKGRINRAKYIDIWGWNFTVQVTLILSYLIYSQLSAQINSEILGDLAFVSLVIFALIGRISLILNAIRRAHDCNQSGWFLLIPFYNFYLIWFKKGTQGDNDYGNNPLYNNLPEKPVDEAKFNKQQRLLKTISFIGIFGGFVSLVVLFLISYF